MFIKNKRQRNQDGTFKKDVGWTPWNEAWSYKMSEYQEAIIRQQTLLLISRNYGKTRKKIKILKRFMKCIKRNPEMELQFQMLWN